MCRLSLLIAMAALSSEVFPDRSFAGDFALAAWLSVPSAPVATEADKTKYSFSYDVTALMKTGSAGTATRRRTVSVRWR